MKFTFEKLIKFISIIRQTSYSDGTIKYSSSKDFDSLEIGMQKEYMESILSTEDRAQNIQIAKSLLREHKISYLNLDDAWSVIHRLGPHDLEVLSEILKDNTEVTSLGIYSWYKQVNKDLFILANICPSITSIILLSNSNAVCEDENLEAIAEGIKANKSIKSLELHIRANGDKTSLKAIENIAEALNESSLERFTLITKDVEEPDIASKLKEGLTYNWKNQDEVVLEKAISEKSGKPKLDEATNVEKIVAKIQKLYDSSKSTDFNYKDVQELYHTYEEFRDAQNPEAIELLGSNYLINQYSE